MSFPSSRSTSFPSTVPSLQTVSDSSTDVACPPSGTIPPLSMGRSVEIPGLAPSLGLEPPPFPSPFSLQPISYWPLYPRSSVGFFPPASLSYGLMLPSSYMSPPTILPQDPSSGLREQARWSHKGHRGDSQSGSAPQVSSGLGTLNHFFPSSGVDVSSSSSSSSHSSSSLFPSTPVFSTPSPVLLQPSSVSPALLKRKTQTPKHKVKTEKESRKKQRKKSLNPKNWLDTGFSYAFAESVRSFDLQASQARHMREVMLSSMSKYSKINAELCDNIKKCAEYGISSDQLKDWIKEGIENMEDMVSLRNLNISPEGLRKWQVYTKDLYRIKQLHTLGYGPDDIEKWKTLFEKASSEKISNHSCILKMVEFREAGIDYETTSVWLAARSDQQIPEKLISYALPPRRESQGFGLPLDYIVDFYKAGCTPEEALEWYRQDIPLQSVAPLTDLQNDGAAPTAKTKYSQGSVKEFRKLALSPRQAGEWYYMDPRAKEVPAFRGKMPLRQIIQFSQQEISAPQLFNWSMRFQFPASLASLSPYLQSQSHEAIREELSRKILQTVGTFVTRNMQTYSLREREEIQACVLINLDPQIPPVLQTVILDYLSPKYIGWKNGQAWREEDVDVCNSEIFTLKNQQEPKYDIRLDPSSSSSSPKPPPPPGSFLGIGRELTLLGESIVDIPSLRAIFKT